MSDFTHLHVHTEASLLDGINRIKELPGIVKAKNQNYLACTEHGTLLGSWEFTKSCRKADVAPIIGMEAYYTMGDHTVREKDELDSYYYHLILLAKNNEGLKNLVKLSSLAYTEGMYRKPRISDSMLADYSDNILATSSCLGSAVSQLILKGKRVAAEKMLDHHSAIFKDRFFIELQLHEDEEQKVVNKVLIEYARTSNLPLIVTGDSHYTTQEDKQLHEIALCMQTKGRLSDEKRFTFGDIDVHVGDHDFMWTRCQELGIPYEAISNTMHIAKMIDHESYFSDRMNHYVRYQKLPEGMNAWDYLKIKAQRGLYNRFGGMPPQNYKDRLDEELDLLKKMDFSDYMLVVADFLKISRDLECLPGAGRGSVGGSLVAWAIRITEVDPIQYGLLFSRFLNYGRSPKPLIFDQTLIKKIDTLPRASVNACSAEKKPCTHSH